MDSFDKLLDMYFEKFGENYPLDIVGDLSDDEIMADIRECISSNTPAKEPEYEKTLIY